MRNVFILLVVGLALAASAAAAQPGAQGVDEAWVAAIKANDLERVVALYADDAVMYPPDEKEARGKAAIRANYQGLLKANTVTDARILETHGKTAGDFSSSWGRGELTLAPKAGGPATAFEVRFTAIAVKRAGKWLYLVDHASAPMPPPPK
jgi:uncharacterized protein (TIGR02246 family)